MSKIPVLSSGVYFGSQHKKRNVGGILLSDSHHVSGQVVPKHSHSNAHFYFVLQGYSKEFGGSSSRSCEPGVLVYHPPEKVHANEWASNGLCFCIELSQERYQQHAGLLDTIDDSSGFSMGLPVFLAHRLYREYQSQDTASLLAIEGITLELLAELSRNEVGVNRESIPRWLARARDAIHDQFLTDLDVNRLAMEACVHPSHFAKEFRRHFNCSTGAYVRNLRIEWACSQLRSTTASVGEIALQSGFYDQSHFARVFKHRVRMTPSQYRKLLLES